MYSYIVMYLAQCSSLLTSNMDVIGYTLYGISYTIVVSVAVSNFAFNSTIRVRNHLSPRGWLTAWNYRYLTFHLFRTFTSQWIKQNEFNEFSTFGDSKIPKNIFSTKNACSIEFESILEKGNSWNVGWIKWTMGVFLSRSARLGFPNREIFCYQTQEMFILIWSKIFLETTPKTSSTRCSILRSRLGGSLLKMVRSSRVQASQINWSSYYQLRFHVKGFEERIIAF